MVISSVFFFALEPFIIVLQIEISAKYAFVKREFLRRAYMLNAQLVLLAG